MKHITKVETNTDTGRETISGFMLDDEGVERKEWMGKVRLWEDVQYAAELMPNKLAGLISPSPMTNSFFGDMQLKIELPHPPSVNAAYINLKRGGRAKSQVYKQWLKDAEAALWGQKITHFDGWVRVVYTFRVPDNRKRDVANLEKCLSDFLVKMGILKDENIRCNSQQWADWLPKGRGVTVEIYPTENKSAISG